MDRLLGRVGEFAVHFHDRVGKERDGLVDLLVGHDQGGQEAHHVLARADQEQALFKAALNDAIARLGGRRVARTALEHHVVVAPDRGPGHRRGRARAPVGAAVEEDVVVAHVEAMLHSPLLSVKH